MKKLFTFSFLFAAAVSSQAQTFWTEDFSTGCSQGNTASSYTGVNGAWTITATGTNDANANQWFVSAAEAGMGVGQCGDGCLNNTNLTNRTLHLGNTAIALVNLPADNGASYVNGGFCQSFSICVVTNRRAESPTINCNGKSNIALSFAYMEGGDGTNDDGTLWYYDGNAWSLLINLPKTPLGNCSPQGQWTAYTINLPSSANNNPNVKIGFNWVNNDDQVGNDPSFAVDDITLSQVTTGMNQIDASAISVYSNDENIYVRSSYAYRLLAVTDMLGNNVKFTQTDNTISLRNAVNGIYFVQLDVNGTRITKKVMIQ
jgi:hypothetical protein